LRLFALLAALTLALPSLAAQEKKPAPRKTTAKPVAHAKPTPQQIRRFDELEKKEQQKEKKKK
jgi:hypothetical protein